MTITTEEAETLAGQLDANEPMVQDQVAVEFFADVATALRSAVAERDAAIARAEKAEKALAGALANLADASRARGEAEGKLAASEMAGIVEGWKARAEKAEAEADLLRAAFRVNAIRWNPDISHAEIDKFVEKVASGDKVLL